MPNKPFSPVDRARQTMAPKAQGSEDGITEARVPRTETQNFVHGILLVVAPYLVLAALWILISDQLAASLFPDPAQLAIVSLLKGWFFVGITGGLLTLLLHRFIRNLEG